MKKKREKKVSIKTIKKRLIKKLNRNSRKVKKRKNIDKRIVWEQWRKVWERMQTKTKREAQTNIIDSFLIYKFIN